MNSPKLTRAAAFLTLLCAVGLSLTVTSCSVSPNGPATVGASHGALGSDNMCDYYYKKSAGWVYAFSNTENIYNSDGSVAQTLTGAPDTVRTLGYYDIAPNGDSLYRLAITYRVTTQYAGRDTITVNYFPPNTNASDAKHGLSGGFVDGSSDLSGQGMLSMLKKPRPVSTDTILAGVIGRVRTLADDFSNQSSYVWQTDTLWASEHSDTVFIWERPIRGGVQQSALMHSRCIFTKDFTHSSPNWSYDLVWNTTTVHVATADMSLSTSAATFPHVAKLLMTTNDRTTGDLPITEYKYFGFGVGFVMEQDFWNVTTDGSTFTKEDFTRSLVSLTHN